MIRFRTIVAGIVLILGATPARAGLIPWSYSATLTGNRGAAYVFDGFGSRDLGYNEDGTLEVAYYTGFTHLGVSANLGVLHDSQQFQLGYTNSSYFFWNPDISSYWPGPFNNVPLLPNNEPLPGGRVDNSFVATLTIRDGTSGRSAPFTVTGAVASGDSYLGLPALLSLNFSDSAHYPDVVIDRVIGQNDYRVAFSATNGDYSAPILPESWLQVNVQVTPVESPEPATVILACLGLTCVVGSQCLRVRLKRSFGSVDLDMIDF